MTPISLRVKFLAGTIGIVLLMGMAMIIFVKTTLYKQLHGKLEKRGVSIARSIAHDSINPILTRKFFELEMLVRDFKGSEDDIEYVFVLGPRGEVLAHTFEKGFPVDLKKLDVAGNDRSYNIQLLDSENRRIHDIAVPLLKGRIGVVHLGISDGPLRKGVNEIIRLIMYIIAAVLVFGSIAAVIFSAAITKPLFELLKGVRALGSGNLDARTSVVGEDEIGQLGRAFNDMVGKRRQAEEELRLSEEKFSDITSSLGEGVLVFDESGKLSFINPEAEQLLGWSAEELSGKNIHDVVHYKRSDGTHLAAEDCPNIRMLETGKRVFNDDDAYIRKDGTMLPVSYISTPIFKQGKVSASVVAFRDITNRKQIEAERERLIVELRDALAKINTLKGMIPICSSCKKIRDDQGFWNSIEKYIMEHSEAEFSHGICPECAKKLYPEYYKEMYK